jgi:hypothetical protein
MKIFRVSLNDPMHENKGYEYFSSKKAAEKCLRDHCKSWDMVYEEDNITMKDVMIGKYEILRLLNEWGSHPDNG